jgi:hypothetical protein
MTELAGAASRNVVLIESSAERQNAIAAPSQAARYATIALLMVVYLAVIWILPVLPCQDLPQHLAFAKILLDHPRPDLRFEEFYTLPSQLNPYHTTYWLIVAFARVVGLQSAFRLVMSVYVVSTFVALNAASGLPPFRAAR